MSNCAQPPGDKMKKVLRWVAEVLAEQPGKKRVDVFRQAQIRFDLSPLECEFLETHFSKEAPEKK